MIKPILALSLLALSIPAFQGRTRTAIPLRGGTMTLEHVVGGETVVRIEAESEQKLAQVQILRPDGSFLLSLETQSGGERGLSGLLVELRESDLGTVFDRYTEGTYSIRAVSASGNPVTGSAWLSFDLPRESLIAYPPPGAVGIPNTGLSVKWLGDPSAVGFHVQLEQNDNDGLAVTLPPGRNSFRIPDGLLAPGTETELEIAAIGANGNRTVVEAVFTTRP